MNEFLATMAFKALLPVDNVVDLRIAEVEGFPEQALIIKRFDRDSDGMRIHFEEFNQLLGLLSRFKYDGAHKDMANFILETVGCLPAEIYRLYLRILAGLLLGNTDMHLKNFAMFNTGSSLRLTPMYDVVSSVLYDYKSVALAIGGAENLSLGSLKASNIIKLGEEFGLGRDGIKMAIDHLTGNVDAAKEVIFESEVGTDRIKEQLIKWIEKRWNGTYTLIGTSLLKKQ